VISLASFLISIVFCSLFFMFRRIALPFFSSSGPMRTANAKPRRSASDRALETLRRMTSTSVVIPASRRAVETSKALVLISSFIGIITTVFCFSVLG